jgi:hypothetical protein
MVSSLPERRRESRQRILMDVRCRIAPGQSPEVWLTEISVTGCQILIHEGLLEAGRNVVIKAKGLEGLPGTVRWVLGEAAGIAFEQPMHPAVLDHLLSGGSQPAGYRSNEFVDQFGRRMPNWPRDGLQPRGRRSVL